MGARNSTGQTLAKSCPKQGITRPKQRKRAVAMVPARSLTGIPGFAKGVVSYWGRAICFVDDPPFFI